MLISHPSLQMASVKAMNTAYSGVTTPSATGAAVATSGTTGVSAASVISTRARAMAVTALATFSLCK